jgi:hypothetical protein
MGTPIVKIERHSPSSLNLYAECRSLYVLERILKKKFPASPRMFLGIAAEEGTAAGLCENKTDAECVEIATRKYGELTRFLPNRDDVDSVGKGVTGMVTLALAELRGYGKPDETQGEITWHPEGLTYPIFGKFDFIWHEHGIVVDLKTTGALPSKVKHGHARQVALYTGGNLEGRLTYVTPKKAATYRLDDVPAHRNALFKMAQACERYLALSDDPEFFVGIETPALESFYFNSREARQAAFETWGV